MKRPSPTPNNDQDKSEKKRKTNPEHRKHHRLVHRQRGADDVAYHPQDTVLIDHQLHKALCVALFGFGFTAVTRRALSSFRDVVQEYMCHFAIRVNESMRTCRRSAPTPQDFVHALAQFDLTPSSLKSELNVNALEAVTQAPILPPSSLETSSYFAFSPELFISADERASLGRQRHPYIPKHFPTYPAKHAYQSTPVYSDRETDLLRIRERATQEGMQAEKALRKLMAANKAAESKARERSKKMTGGTHSESEGVWSEALAAMDEEDRSRQRKDDDEIMLGLDGATEAREHEIAREADTGVGGTVNYDRMFWRRGSRRARLQSS